MRRRDALISSVAIWPLAARAQQLGQMRRIGVLLYWASSNREGQAGVAAFQKALQQAGWTEGVNIHADIRSSEESAERGRRLAAELVALAPDVILANAPPLPIAATIALEMIGPIPGTVITLRQLSSLFANVSISSVTASIRSSSCRQSVARSATMHNMRGESTSVRLARMSGSAWRRKRSSPCAGR